MNNPIGTADQVGRISFPEPGSMTDDQRHVYDQIVSGPRGTIVGPLRAALHNPSLADKWQKLGQVLRFETSFPKRLNEVAILVTARRWNSVLEWAIHARDAAEAGLAPHIIEAIRTGAVPEFADDHAAAEIYRFAAQLVQKGDTDQSVYSAIVARWGEVGAVELAAVIGYYSMVAITLNVHQIPVPPGIPSTLETKGNGLFESPTVDTKEY